MKKVNYLLLTVTILIILVFVPPFFLCALPTCLLWQPSHNEASLTNRARIFFRVAVITAFIPGTLSFWGFEVLYISLLERVSAVTHLMLPYIATDNDSFEYFANSKQAVLFTIGLILLLLPTYSAGIIFYYQNKRKLSR